MPANQLGVVFKQIDLEVDPYPDTSLILPLRNVFSEVTANDMAEAAFRFGRGYLTVTQVKPNTKAELDGNTALSTESGAPYVDGPVRRITAIPGGGIVPSDAAEWAIWLSQSFNGAPVHFEFNGVALKANYKSTPQEVMGHYEDAHRVPATSAHVAKAIGGTTSKPPKLIEASL